MRKIGFGEIIMQSFTEKTRAPNSQETGARIFDRGGDDP
jgi:hypothetical protein